MSVLTLVVTTDGVNETLYRTAVELNGTPVTIDFGVSPLIVKSLTFQVNPPTEDQTERIKELTDVLDKISDLACSPYEDY